MAFSLIADAGIVIEDKAGWIIWAMSTSILCLIVKVLEFINSPLHCVIWFSFWNKVNKSVVPSIPPCPCEVNTKILSSVPLTSFVFCWEILSIFIKDCCCSSMSVYANYNFSFLYFVITTDLLLSIFSKHVFILVL